MKSDRLPRAMGGGLLLGDKPVRYIFVDEAGTSAKEPCSIVAGIIAHADEHVMLADALVAETLGAVPSQFQHDFVFHAKDVFGGAIYRDDWSMADRLKLLKSMMSIPRRLGMAIALGVVQRSATGLALQSMSLENSHHYFAFMGCISRADKYIRDHAGPREVATVVAEDCPQMQKHLKHIPKLLRTTPIDIHPSWIRMTGEERELGFITQESETRISRTRQAIHFVDKRDDPLLQLADACAYGFRRFFACQPHGDDFAKAILGDRPIKKDDFQDGVSFCCFRFHP